MIAPTFTIYMARDPEGFAYIGCTKRSAEQRWRGHYRHTGRPWPGRDSAGVCDGIRRFGHENFTITTLAVVDNVQMARAVETTMIDLHSTMTPHGYNRRLASGYPAQGAAA